MSVAADPVQAAGGLGHGVQGCQQRGQLGTGAAGAVVEQGGELVVQNAAGAQVPGPQVATAAVGAPQPLGAAQLRSASESPLSESPPPCTPTAVQADDVHAIALSRLPSAFGLGVVTWRHFDPSQRLISVW